MASRNVEIVQQFMAAFEQRDVEGLIVLCSREMVFEPQTAQIAAAGEPYRGHAGLRRYMEDVAQIWQELRPVPDAYHELDSGIVVATGRVYAWGAGRVIDAPAGWLWRVQDGLIVYGRTFGSASGALEAAGLTVPGADASA
ncbi:nuclear transport factor 2 family protein [Baekduia sp. Peel2402]|uniref:nuclear transport factor 2 family protein n=1 Tax=Baekduia sp. Peel2402 TaxID=3458296 RepID=UPI00403E76ED